MLPLFFSIFAAIMVSLRRIGSHLSLPEQPVMLETTNGSSHVAKEAAVTDGSFAAPSPSAAVGVSPLVLEQSDALCSSPPLLQLHEASLAWPSTVQPTSPNKASTTISERCGLAEELAEETPVVSKASLSVWPQQLVAIVGRCAAAPQRSERTRLHSLSTPSIPTPSQSHCLSVPSSRPAVSAAASHHSSHQLGASAR